MPIITQTKPTPFSIAACAQENWEGDFEGKEGSLSELQFRVLATLYFGRGAIEGEGLAPSFPANQDTLTFTGVAQGRYAEFEVWLKVQDLDRKPFICIGALDLDAGTINGTFTVDCLDPYLCGCRGGDGLFRLRRRRTVV